MSENKSAARVFSRRGSLLNYYFFRFRSYFTDFCFVLVHEFSRDLIRDRFVERNAARGTQLPDFCSDLTEARKRKSLMFKARATWFFR